MRSSLGRLWSLSDSKPIKRLLGEVLISLFNTNDRGLARLFVAVRNPFFTKAKRRGNQ